MKTLPTPKTNTQEVLKTLIDNGEVSILDFPYLSGFRTRVSELSRKYKLSFQTKMRRGRNKFGNSYTYAVHSLEDKRSAIQLYLNLIKN